MEQETLVALRKAGWSVTVMGLQSGSHSVRKRIYNRRETNAQILVAARRLDALRAVKSLHGVFRIYYDYVKNNVLETQGDLRESLDLILSLPKNFIFQAFNLSFFPNYLLTRVYLEKGFITENDIEGNSTASGNDWITSFDKRREYRGFLRIHEYYYLLFSLAQFKLFPNTLVRWMERRGIFFGRLRSLHLLCRTVRFLDLYFRPSNYVWLFAILRMVSLRLKYRHGAFVRLR